MMPFAEPPRLARLLLARALPENAREHIVGDLLEVYTRRCARDGVARARLWYWREVASFSARFLVERVVDARRRARDPQRRSLPQGVVPSGLDIRLGLRMLVKYPGLSMIAVTGMAVAIAIGAISFSVIAALMATTLPLPEGDRLVVARNVDVTDASHTHASLRDFLAWRDGLKSVEDLSAFTAAGRNLAVPGADVDLVRVARMTASGFRVARTSPLLGRPLLDEDERTNARVVVIAFDEWQRRFAADPHIIGRDIGLGAEHYTIVGVMPDGFHFPVADRYWIPLRFDPAEREAPDAISLTVFGRLPEGATIDGAQAELSTIASRMKLQSPSTYEQMRPQLLSYTRAFFDLDGLKTQRTAHLFRLFVSLLLVVVAVNVAILVYARTSARAGEIAIRTALGASRARVVTQLFAEALVLSLTAAFVGLTITGITLAKLQALAQTQTGRRIGQLPFWLELGLSPAVMTYVLVLAIVGAAIIGVLPALKATGSRVQANLQRLSGQGSRMELGRAWTALIVAQVAIAVAVLPFAGHFAEETIADATRNPGYRTEEFLEASLALASASRDTSAASQRMIDERSRLRAAELMRRLESDPAVAGVTIRMRGSERIEVEGIASQGVEGRPIYTGSEGVDRVEANFFALYGLPVLAGRAFVDADARAAPTTVIVNQVFADRQLGSGAPLGRRLRFVRDSGGGRVISGPWLEIVGVVRDFQTNSYEPHGQIYLPANVAGLSLPISLAIRMRASPAARFMPQLRGIAAAVDPDLQLEGLASATELHRERRQFPRYLAIATTAVMASGLLLSAAGIYAMMSFTVTRRRREIGIRSALGAEPGRVLRSIFARASAQLGAGIVLGLIGTVALDRVIGRGPVHDGNSVVLLFVAVLMTAIGLLAAVGPARRGLAIQPTEALREE